jgi:LytR cell envelope-related transcriptional attenuator
MTFARVRALVLVGVLVVLAVGFVGYALAKDTQRGSTVAASCPAGWVIADLALRPPEQVKINVFNATDKPNLATAVANDFKNRKFKVEKTGNDKRAVEDVAVLRYGPKAVGSAHLLKAYFLGEADTEYDPARADDLVDVVIGDSFKQLATTTEVNQSLVELKSPALPAQACEAPKA